LHFWLLASGVSNHLGKELISRIGVLKERKRNGFMFNLLVAPLYYFSKTLFFHPCKLYRVRQWIGRFCNIFFLVL